MTRCAVTRLLLFLFVAGFISEAQAQAPRPRPGSGLVRTPPEVYRSFPVAPRYRAFIPPEWDLSSQFPVPGHQGFENNTCTAWAVSYMRSYYAGKQRRWNFSSPAELISPSFIYTRLHNQEDCGTGTAIPAALDLLKTEGAATLAVFPPSALCAQVPDPFQASVASQFRIRSFRVLEHDKEDDIKGQIYAGNPVVFALAITDPFYDQPRGTIYEGLGKFSTDHAMIVVGYSDKRQAFKVLNSWGTDWADDGFVWVSYRAFMKLAFELYVIDSPDAGPFSEPKVIAQPTPIPAPPTPAPQPVKVLPSIAATQTLVNNRVAQVPCSKIDAAVTSDRTARLNGFAGSQADVDRLRTDLAALPGVGRLDANIVVHPWPQCEVYLNYAVALSEPRGLGITLKGAPGNNFKAGDSLTVDVVSPAFPSYLYVTYLQASGDAVHLYSPAGKFAKPVPPHSRLTFGGGGDQPIYRVGEPFGDEIVVVIASASPLFDRELPDNAGTEREYLTTFRRAFLAPDGPASKRYVSAVAAKLKTQRRN